MAEENHDPIEELLPAYALNALEPEERETVERALEREPRYQELLADYLQGVAVLSAAHHAAVPSPSLRQRVLGGASTEAVAPVALAPRGRMAVPSSFWGVAAALVVAVLGIGSFAVVQQQRVDELVDEMDSMAAEYAETESRLQEQQELTQLAIQPGVSRAAMRAVSPPTPPREPAAGMLFHKPGGGRVLWITNLEPLEDGTMYQAWLRESEQDAYSIAIFEVDDTGQALVPVRVPDDSSQWSWLTVNRAPVGGATEPMGSPLLAGRIE